MSNHAPDYRRRRSRDPPLLDESSAGRGGCGRLTEELIKGFKGAWTGVGATGFAGRTG